MVSFDAVSLFMIVLVSPALQIIETRWSKTGGMSTALDEGMFLEGATLPKKQYFLNRRAPTHRLKS